MIGYLEPHGRLETEELADGPRGGAAAARRSTATRRSRRWTCRRSSRARPELCLIDELAHTNAAGVEHEKRWQDVETVARGRHRRVLDRQRPAPGEPQRPGRRADRHARARDDPRLGARGRRRGRADRHHAAGADRAPARRQDLPPGPHRGGAQQLLPDREPRGAARGRAAPGRRGGRGQAPRRSAGPLREDLLDPDRGAAGRRRAPARADHALAAVPARRAARLALGAAARRRARPAVDRQARASSRARRQTRSSPPCAGSRRCSARTCSSRRASR